MSEEEIKKIDNKYLSFEIHYPSTEPSKEGEYFGKTPLFEQAYQAAQNIGGSLYGITSSGEKVFIDYNPISFMTPTLDMITQSELYAIDQDNSEIIHELLQEIINTAYEKGFTGYCDLWESCDDDSKHSVPIVDIFKNKQECIDGVSSECSAEHPLALINYFETEMISGSLFNKTESSLDDEAKDMKVAKDIQDIPATGHDKDRIL